MTQLNFMVKLHPSSQLQIHEDNRRGVAFSLELNDSVIIKLKDNVTLVNHQLKNCQSESTGPSRQWAFQLDNNTR